MSQHSHYHLWPDVQMALGSAVLFGLAAPLSKLLLDNNLTRKLSSSDPVLIALIKGLVAGATNIGVALLRGCIMPPSMTVAAASLVGFLGVGVSLVLFVLALRHLGTARTGDYFSLAPFIGAIVALVCKPIKMQDACAKERYARLGHNLSTAP